MKEILISTYSSKIRSGVRNPKNYPWWPEIILGLHERGYAVSQLCQNDELLFIDSFYHNFSLKEIQKKMELCFTWFSVDNFLPHLANLISKPGIAIFGQSDPLIFGYPQNLNILKDRKYLRKEQFVWWSLTDYREEVFESPEIILQKFDTFALTLKQ